MKYLITGGCGFLGSNLAAACLGRGAEVAILDNLSREGSSINHEWLKSKGSFKFHKIDIRNSGEVEKIVEDFRPSVVFHLAGQVAMTTSIENPRLDFETNAVGTMNVLEALRKTSPDSVLIFSSTNKVYGNLEGFPLEEKEYRYELKDLPLGFDERTPLEFCSPYGCSKGTADQYVLDYARVFGIKGVVLRHSSIFGDRQFSTADQGWIGWFIHNALQVKSGVQKAPFTISGNGKQVRDVLFATDLVNCYFSAVEGIETAMGHAFNIGGGRENSLSLLELFKVLEEKLDIRLSFEKLPWRCSDQRVFIADIRKAKQLFSWYPTIDKITGIERMLEWVKDA